MKKLSLLPTLIVLVIGGVFAATQLFPPSSTEFPSVPTQPGTIGYILSLFDPDGTARNTDRLGGVTASGYLQNNLCDPTKVWTGIDANGKAICGTRQALLVGNFTEGSMSVKRGTASPVALNIGDPIKEGDLLITSSSQTGTIQFAQDASYIRLDTDTTVEIRTGLLGGQTVAEAILADGQLWGRILTNTGVNLGGGGLVAGVRGTSVAVTKNGTNVTIAIIDSRNSGTDAATISRADGTTLQTVGSGTLLVFASGATPTPTITRPTKTELLTTVVGHSWIRDNTLDDIVTLATLSGASVTNASGELTSTLSGTTVPAVATALCTTKETSNDKVFWPSLVGTIHDPCQLSDIVAFASCDSSKKASPLYYQNGSVSLGTDSKYSLTGSLYLSGSRYTLSGTTQAGTSNIKINQGNSPTSSSQSNLFGGSLYLSGSSTTSSGCGGSGIVQIFKSTTNK